MSGLSSHRPPTAEYRERGREGSAKGSEGAKEVGREIAEKGRETGQALKEGSNEVGEKIKGEAAQVSREVKDGLTETRRKAQKQSRALGDWFRETGKRTGETLRQMGKDIRRFLTGK